MNIRQKILNIAHRGARSLAPENTLAAALVAYECGADMWECDVVMTADGIPIVIHDDTLRRTTNASSIYPNRKPWKVNAFTLDELKKLDFGSWFITTDPFRQIKVGNIKPIELQRFVGEPVLTLREALAFTKGHNWQINIEIKDQRGTPANENIVQTVSDLIAEMDMVDQVFVSSFNHKYITTAKDLVPGLRTGALVEWLDLNPLARMRDTGARSYNPGVRLANPRLVRSIRDEGFDVFVWTVNKETSMRKLIKTGVTGIITDFPQVLKTVLDGYSH
jgi:glycerophosphoryl diester phosphodiesterase